MTMILLGMAIFFGVHLLPWAPRLRQRLVARLGERLYKGTFALIAAAGLAALVHGYAGAPYMHLWSTPSWGPAVAVVAVPLAAVLVAAAYTGASIKRLTPHPFNWGVALWAAVHLVNNGDAASMLLFGGFLAYALADIAAVNARGAVIEAVPRSLRRDGLALAIGLAAAAALAHFHAALFGVAISL